MKHSIISSSAQSIIFSHTDLLTLKSTMGYPVDNAGECLGVAGAAVCSMMVDDPISFIERFQTMSQLMRKQALIISEEKEQLSLRPFFDIMTVIQQGINLPHLYEEKPRKIHDLTLRLTFPLIAPLKLNQPVEPVSQWQGAYVHAELTKYFKMLKKELQESSIENPVAFLLQNSMHAIAIGWFPKENYWWFVDANQLHILTLKIKNEDQLAAYTLQGFSKNSIAVFHTEVYAIQSEAMKVSKSIEYCWEISDWQKLHALEEKRIQRQDSDGSCLLYLAAKRGELESLNNLIDHKADVDQATDDGTTPLCIAALCGHLNIVTTLIKAGANIEKAAVNNSTPLYAAAQHGHKEIVDTLLKERAKYDVAILTDLQSLYNTAEEKKHQAEFEQLLESKGLMAEKTLDGFTPLHAAAFFGHTEVVDLLLAAGADPFATTEKNISPLELAETMGNTIIVDKLKVYQTRIDKLNFINKLQNYIQKGDKEPESKNGYGIMFQCPRFINVRAAKKVLSYLTVGQLPLLSGMESVALASPDLAKIIQAHKVHLPEKVAKDLPEIPAFN